MTSGFRKRRKGEDDELGGSFVSFLLNRRSGESFRDLPLFSPESVDLVSSYESAVWSSRETAADLGGDGDTGGRKTSLLSILFDLDFYKY